jgi:hypothetical protein
MKTLGDARVRASILRRLAQLRPDSPRRWGQMSAHQMVCHLSDSARMALGERQVSRATGLHRQTFLKWVALYAPLPWPAGVITRPEVDQAGGGTLPREFSTDLETLQGLTRRLIEQAGQLEGREHPIFGRLSRAAWLRWAYLHMDHHLRQFGV